MASEPSFYGYMCFFMLLFCFDIKNKIIYMIILFAQIILVAQSSVSLIYLGVLGVLYLFLSLFKRKDKIKIIGYIVLVLIGLGIALKYIMTVESSSRMILLIRTVLKYGLNNLLEDESVFLRFQDIVQSFTTYGIPQFIGKGLGMMSGIGSLFYELGWFSLFIIAYIFKVIYKSDKLGIVYALTIMICMISAIQLSLPTVWLYIGWCLYKNSSLYEK